ncbi:Tetratricopeptide repeat-containing protein [Spirosomataceae bacterium TFI 002]|nr:Tetratricopeptide repeat-containing protein [Spirosomataceae bacterium TFI 002]
MIAKSTYKLFIFFGLLFLSSSHVLAQSEETLKANISKQREIQYYDNAQSIKMAIENVKLAKKLKSSKLGQTLGNLADAYYDAEQIDSVNKYLSLAIAENKRENNQKRLARNFVFQGTLESDKGNKLKAIEWYEIAMEKFIALDDTFNLADTYLRISDMYIDLDRLDEAMLDAKKCYDYCKSVNYSEYAGYALSSMGVIHTKIGNLDKSIELFNEALVIFENENLPFASFNVESNIGVSYKKGKQYEKALIAYQKALKMSKELDFPRGEMAVLGNLGILYNEMKKFQLAKESFDAALEISKKVKNALFEADLHINYARTLLNLRNIQKAKLEIGKGRQMATEIGSVELQMDAHKVAKEIYQKTGETDLALSEMEAFQVLNDSLFNLAKTKQINELQSKYETVKKDAEIQLLTKTNAINTWRIWALVAGLVALLSLAFSLYQKRKKDKQLYEKEKALEAERREKAEMELDSKKKELSAKVLQLARKNEFLGTLESQVAELKTNVDGSINKASNRISKMIKRDIDSDKQWEQFSQEFSSIHHGFLNRLAEKYGTFTKSEVRLISLLKMNMNSKEIADIMGISDDGVKKARYRLRKKMNVEESDIQGFLLSF